MEKKKRDLLWKNERILEEESKNVLKFGKFDESDIFSKNIIENPISLIKDNIKDSSYFLKLLNPIHFNNEFEKLRLDDFKKEQFQNLDLEKENIEKKKEEIEYHLSTATEEQQELLKIELNKIEVEKQVLEQKELSKAKYFAVLEQQQNIQEEEKKGILNLFLLFFKKRINYFLKNNLKNNLKSLKTNYSLNFLKNFTFLKFLYMLNLDVKRLMVNTYSIYTNILLNYRWLKFLHLSFFKIILNLKKIILKKLFNLSKKQWLKKKELFLSGNIKQYPFIFFIKIK